MSLFEQFEVSAKAEKEGVWIEYGPNKDGSIPAFKIARMSKANLKYTKALEKATRPYRRQIELDTMDPKQGDKIFTDVFAECVLLDWRNVNKKDGSILQYSKENAVWLLNELPELYEDLRDKAGKASLFRLEELEKDAKN